MEEGEGSSEMDYTAIETTANSLDNSITFHVVKDVLGFVLYMHQQIPSILQDLSLEFETLQTEYKELDTALTQAEVKPSFRRKQNGRMRDVKSSIRRLDKLMKTISGLEMALQLLITEISVEGVILVLGASPIRPHYVYQLCFSHGHNVQKGGGFVKSRAAEGLSRKAIRALISKGAGSASYPGPTKLFVLVKAPSSFNLPLHFLPKRDFRYSKKCYARIFMLMQQYVSYDEMNFARTLYHWLACAISDLDSNQAYFSQIFRAFLLYLSDCCLSAEAKIQKLMLLNMVLTIATPSV